VLKQGSGLSNLEKRKSQIDYMVEKRKYAAAILPSGNNTVPPCNRPGSPVLLYYRLFEELQEGIIRLRISVEMRDDTHLKVELEDLGFGTFRAATHHIDSGIQQCLVGYLSPPENLHSDIGFEFIFSQKHMMRNCGSIRRYYANMEMLPYVPTAWNATGIPHL